MGLDLSMGATGLADVDGWTTTIKPKLAGDLRLVEIGYAVIDRRLNASLAVLEEAPPGLKGPAIKAIHMVHGAVRHQLVVVGLEYITVNPTTLKQFATGSTRATKADMAVALFKRAGLELGDDNQVDAWWLRAAGLQLLGAPVVKLPAAQVAALDKVRDRLGAVS
jgi:hypothetical protein